MAVETDFTLKGIFDGDQVKFLFLSAGEKDVLWSAGNGAAGLQGILQKVA